MSLSGIVTGFQYAFLASTLLNVLGLVVGLLLAFTLEAFDNSLKTPADVERFVGLTTLGAIPTAPDV